MLIVIIIIVVKNIHIDKMFQYERLNSCSYKNHTSIRAGSFSDSCIK